MNHEKGLSGKKVQLEIFQLVSFKLETWIPGQIRSYLKTKTNPKKSFSMKEKNEVGNSGLNWNEKGAVGKISLEIWQVF